MLASYTSFIAPITGSTALTGTLPNFYNVAKMPSITGSYNTDPIWLTHNNGFSVFVATSGSVSLVGAGPNLTGTLKVQVSNDAANPPAYDAMINKWIDVPGSSQSIIGNDSYYFEAPFCFARYARVVYTHTTGSGPMFVQVATKQIRG